RQQLDFGAVTGGFEAAPRIGHMPAEMPDRALRYAGRGRTDLGKQHHYIVLRFGRWKNAPAAPRGACKRPRLEADRCVRIDGVEVDMMKFWGRQHIGPSSQQRQFPRANADYLPLCRIK